MCFGTVDVNLEISQARFRAKGWRARKGRDVVETGAGVHSSIAETSLQIALVSEKRQDKLKGGVLRTWFLHSTAQSSAVNCGAWGVRPVAAPLPQKAPVKLDAA